MSAYYKYFRFVTRTFRMQILWEQGYWMRCKFRDNGDLYEVDLPGFDLERFQADLAAINPWNVFAAKAHTPYIKKVFEDVELATKVVTLQVRPQRLFKHEDRKEIIYSSLITMKSREPSDVWHAYHEGKQ
jgi:hypothetical protein